MFAKFFNRKAWAAPASDVPTDDFVVGIQCCDCGWVIPQGEYPLGVEVRCRKPKCGVRLTTTDGTVLDGNGHVLEVLEADRDIYCLAADESAAKMVERAWFHITREDDWLGSVDETRGEHYPHVGSLGTVKEYYMNAWSWGRPGRIHAVKFKDGTRFADGAAIHDLNENAEWADMMRRESKTVDAVRYVNVHEYAGSVSVIAVPEVLEVTGTYEFANPKEFNALVTQLGAMDAELLSA